MTRFHPALVSTDYQQETQVERRTLEDFTHEPLMVKLLRGGKVQVVLNGQCGRRRSSSEQIPNLTYILIFRRPFHPPLTPRFRS